MAMVARKVIVGGVQKRKKVVVGCIRRDRRLSWGESGERERERWGGGGGGGGGTTKYKSTINYFI